MEICGDTVRLVAITSWVREALVVGIDLLLVYLFHVSFRIRASHSDVYFPNISFLFPQIVYRSTRFF